MALRMPRRDAGAIIAGRLKTRHLGPRRGAAAMKDMELVAAIPAYGMAGFLTARLQGRVIIGGEGRV